MKGQILTFIIIFLVLMSLPLVLGFFFPQIDILIKLYLVLSIFLFVKGILGNGIPTYIVAGVLIYIFIFRLYPLFAASYVLYLIASLGLSSIIFFGFQGVAINKMFRPKRR